MTDDPWAAITSPVTVRQYKERLDILNSAEQMLDKQDPEHRGVDMDYARRLAFARWRVLTGRCHD